MQKRIYTMAKNPDLRIILETNNGSQDGVGKYFLLGQYNGLTLSGGTAQSGTAFGDKNGYTLTFTSQEPTPASEIQYTGFETYAIDDAINSPIYASVSSGFAFS